MKTIESPVIINGYLYAKKYEWEAEYSFNFSTSEKLEDSGYLLLGAHTIVHTIPDNFDVTAAELIALQKSKVKAVEAFQAEMDRVNKRITQLLTLSAPTTSNGMEVLEAETPAYSEPSQQFRASFPDSDEDIPF
jgi:predicted outer membrane protein